MRLLLDTHVLIWWDEGARLKPEASRAIRDADQVFVTQRTVADALLENHFEELPIHLRHAAEVAHLPWHHRDPFDRLLIAQARTDHLTIVTRDPAFRPYAGIKLLPA